jgi:hypothetical protein
LQHRPDERLVALRVQAGVEALADQVPVFGAVEYAASAFQCSSQLSGAQRLAGVVDKREVVADASGGGEVVRLDFRVVLRRLKASAAGEPLGGAFTGELEPKIADTGGAGRAFAHEIPVHRPMGAGPESREAERPHVGVDQERQQ